MSPESALPPLRTGSLESTPFAVLIMQLWRERFTGTVALDHAGRELLILFRAGRPVAAGPLERGAQLEQGLVPLCAASSGRFRLFAEDLVGSDPGVTRGTFSRLTFLHAALREHISDGEVEATLAAHEGATLQLAARIDAHALGMQRAEALLLERLRRPQVLEQWVTSSGWPREKARRLAYYLILTECVTVGAPAGSSNTSHTRMRAVSSLPPERTSSAPADRPSAIPAAQLPAWQQIAARRMSSAPPRRASSAPASPPASPADPAREIERLLRVRDMAAALRQVRHWVDASPGNADAQSMLCWVLLQCSPTGPVSGDLVEAVNRALRLDPANPRALYTKALAYRRMGREEDALRCFHRTAQADPHHIEARREIRLAQMRGTGKPRKH